MTTVNYPSPVTVNGYSCKNCTDVDYAKKNIDPAHPKDGPFGVDAKQNASPLAAAHKASAPQDKPAVTFGGVLANVSQTSSFNAAPSSTQSNATLGQRVDVSA